MVALAFQNGAKNNTVAASLAPGEAGPSVEAALSPQTSVEPQQPRKATIGQRKPQAKKGVRSGRVQEGKKGHPKWTIAQKIIFLKMCPKSSTDSP